MNVITYDVYKNTVKKHDGFNPVTSEKNYSKLQFRFRGDDVWKNCTLVTASFWISNDNIVKSDVELLSDNLTATFDIPPEFSGVKGALKVGLQGTYVKDNEEVTVSTNIITLNRNTGAIITEGASQSLYESLLAIWRDYLDKIDKNVMGKINISVEEYLAAHPELTTTVQNGSITEAKFADVLKLKKASFYRNVAEMKADTSLKPGMTAVVLGYYDINDGGAAEYHIGESGNITLDAFRLVGDANNVIEHYKAQIVIKPQMAVECFGAKGDGVTDDSSAIKEASSYDTQVVFNKKTYLIATPMYIENNVIWIGYDTVIKIKDDIDSIDIREAYIIKISGETYIEGLSIIYKSQYRANVTDQKPHEYAGALVLKIVSGKQHTLKNVNIYITESDITDSEGNIKTDPEDGSRLGAEVNAVWYDFATRNNGIETFTDEVHSLYVSNCKISNLSTGHDTGTSCLWATGIFDNIVVEKSEFTRNHRGDVVGFWANNETIKNILINDCIFNLTNNLCTGASALGFGASSKYPTTYKNINVKNTTFNIGAGYGNSCISCATPETVINIESCKFYKTYDDSVTIPDDTNNADYFKRLSLFQVCSDTDDVTKTSTVNVVNCDVINKKGPIYLDLMSANSYDSDGSIKYYGTYLTKYNFIKSRISSFSHIYNAANVSYNDCEISFNNADEAMCKYLSLKSLIRYINTDFKSCNVDVNVKLNGNVVVSKSKFSSATTITFFNGNDISLADSIFYDLKITTATESTVMNSLVMKNNSINTLDFTSSGTTVNVDNIGTLADSVTFLNNINSKTLYSSVLFINVTK